KASMVARRTRSDGMNRVAGCALGAGLVLGTVFLALASSHREAPLISSDPLADNTDVYAFVSPDATQTVTLVAKLVEVGSAARRFQWDPVGDEGDRLRRVRAHERIHIGVEP